jgi:AmmeMemoRadiSam system protein A
MHAFSRTISGTGGTANALGPSERALTPAERRALLEVARAAIRAAVAGGPAPALPEDLPPRLRERAGAFVTLHHGRELRGCIGSLYPEGSLAALVAHMGAAAALTDPRFSPVGPEEITGLHVEISVLSRARRVRADEIEPHRHGVALALRRRRAVLLPQVAARHGWDRETLLAQLSAKAGLDPGAWKDDAAVLRAFTVYTVSGPL